MTLGAPLRETCPRGHSMAENRRRHPNGDSYCTACKRIRYTRHRKENPEIHARYSRHSRLRSTYGIEPEAYQALLARQDFRCAVCETDDWGIRGPHVDHCHGSGEVRGLLCHRCNTALGLFKDSVETMERAMQYLGKSRRKKK